MHSRILSSQALALLDTRNLPRPSREIEEWLKSDKGWAIALYRDDEVCAALLLAVEDENGVVCTTLSVSVTESDDTLAYRLINTLCQQVPGLEPAQIRAQLPQTNKGVLEALKVMGVKVTPLRSAPITTGPSDHFAA